MRRFAVPAVFVGLLALLAGCGGGGETVVPPPDLVAVTPATGGVQGGRLVTLTGPRIGLGSPEAIVVTFAGSPAAAVTVIDDETVSCVAPVGTAGPCDVAIATGHGADTLLAGFTYVPSPSLVSVTPPAGPLGGGTALVLAGSGFLDHDAGTPTVTIGANAATNVAVGDDGTITCDAPAQLSLGAYDVVVSNDLGTVTRTGAFAYVPAPTLTGLSIPDGPAGGLTLVTLTGAAFDVGGVDVTFDGVAATEVTVLTPLTLTCLTPAGAAGPAVVAVRTYGGTATLSGAFDYTTFAPTDPLYADQWHLLNTAQFASTTAGEDAHVVPAWDLGYTGRGVTVAVVDDGLEIGHEDLAGNVKAGASWDYAQNDADPTTQEHGTSVAGVIAAVPNSIGVVGAAPRSRLVGYVVLASGTTNGDFADALARDASVTDAYNNSWGDPAYYGGVLYGYADAPSSFHAAVDQGLRLGRGGLGSVYVKAAGNSGAPLANFDGTNGIRGVNVIGAVGSEGTASYYSQPGPCILVCAPSNDSSPRPGITTTDRTGSAGYSTTSYTSTFGGTSSATPLVSGVVALILEVRPTLRWWEVPLVLAETARKNDPTHAAWVQNGVGRWVNHQYGFGVVDAAAAVEAARTWTPRAGLVSTTASRSVGAVVLKGNATGVTSTIDVPTGTGISAVHRATVRVYSDHTAASDLTITLTSPYGTQSVLGSSIRAPSTASNSVSGVALVSWRHLGEAPEGTWSLKLSDGQGVHDSTWSSWTLTLEGEGSTPAPAAATVASQTVGPVGAARPAAPQGLAEGDVAWWNGDRWCRARRDASLIAEWAHDEDGATWLARQDDVAGVERAARGFRILRLAPGTPATAVLERAPFHAAPVTGPVFRDGPDGDGRLRVLSDRVLVRLEPGLSARAVAELEAAHGLRPARETSLGADWRVYRVAPGGPSPLEVAARLLRAPGVRHAEPDWWTERQPY